MRARLASQGLCEGLEVAKDALRNALVVVRAARAWSSAKKNAMKEVGGDAELAAEREVAEGVKERESARGGPRLLSEASQKVVARRRRSHRSRYRTESEPRRVTCRCAQERCAGVFWECPTGCVRI